MRHCLPLVRLPAAAAALCLWACAPMDLPPRASGTAPHDVYEAQIRELDAHLTALGRDWITAANRALTAPIEVELPYREARYLDPAGAAAVAYRIKLESGQRVVARVNVAGATHADVRLFLDLFFWSDANAPPRQVASAPADRWELDYVASRQGDYLLRVQPELLRGGRATVTVSAHASLGFPVAGRGMGQVRSRFGASRDAGTRDHEGVDIFAPRGTPVLAAAPGRVTRVTTDRAGGKVIWLEETALGRRLYYAHLDSQAVRGGTMVNRGDTLGYVGNSGNARTTSPHLHFAVYWRGQGAANPSFHLQEPPGRPAAFAGDTGLIGRRARTLANTWLRALPNESAANVARIETQTPVQVLAGAGRWYLARLPDGRQGYLGVGSAGRLDPLHVATVATASVVRTFPASFGFELDSIARGQVVPVLGKFGRFLLVRHPNGHTGWIGSAALGSPRPTPSGG